MSTRIERATRDVNVILLVFAIGLAALDLTCFCAFQVHDALPSAARVSANPALAGSQTIPATQTAAALATTRPQAALHGW